MMMKPRGMQLLLAFAAALLLTGGGGTGGSSRSATRVVAAQAQAALPGAVVDGAPVYSAGVLVPTTRAATTAPAVAAVPTRAAATPPAAAAAAASSQCVAAFAAAAQCGGNMTNPRCGCAQFGGPGSCTNVAWPGGACPAAAACAEVPASGGVCWTCGGGLPAALTQAAAAAAAAGGGGTGSMCTAPARGGGDFDYGCALGASMLFYEAQRSGRLPADNRVAWRGDSLLADAAPNGAPLSGGWFDAGDLTRFTFPAAFTASILALGLLEFGDAYDAAGQTRPALANLRWAADWLLKARYADDAFVAVTWAPGATIKESHLFWGRPEQLPPGAASSVRALVAPQKGADLLAQGAAALAAASVVFAERDAPYSRALLDAARGLYKQACDSDGLYSESVPEVQGFYDSFSYIDDLAWAAAWLAMRTGDEGLLEEAKFHYKRHWEVEGGGEGRRLDYNNLAQPVGFLLARLDPDNAAGYTQPIRDVMDLWLKAKSSIEYTPQGLAWIDGWGNLRYVANQAFMALLHTKLYPPSRLAGGGGGGGSVQTRRAQVYTCWARKQARIILGADGGGEAGEGGGARSYVVGVGRNPPCQPHHRGASCVAAAAGGMCDCAALFNPGCNPNAIVGALVGGPARDGSFDDVRTNFEALEVALDWNAGFTGALAGLADGGSGVSWDDCKAAGLEGGRGDVSPALNGAAGGRSGGALWRPLLAACVVALLALFAA